MKKLLEKRIFSYVFGVIVIFMLGLCLFDYLNEKFSSLLTVSADVGETSEWDGSEDYPVVDDEESALVVEQENSDVFYEMYILLRDTKNRFVLATDNWESRVTDSNSLYYLSVLANKVYDRICGLSLGTSIAVTNDVMATSDIVVDLGDNYLALVVDEALVNKNAESNLSSLIDFGTYIENDGRNFLFVLAPDKLEMTDYTGVISEIYPDSSSYLRDLVLNTMITEGFLTVSVLDELELEGKATLDAFYQTDHHWNVRTALFTCGLLSEYLNYEFDYNVDVSLYDLDNYTSVILEDFWLGSLGIKSTEVYSELEDFEILLPTYETNLTVYRSKSNTTYYGSIQETLFNWEIINDTHSLYVNTVWSFYGYGDFAYTSIHNEDIDDGSRVLLIKTSFGNAVAPYLAASVEYLDILDVRHFTGSVKDFIDDIDPDTVIVLYNTGAFVANNDWDHTDLFDFR